MKRLVMIMIVSVLVFSLIMAGCSNDIKNTEEKATPSGPVSITVFAHQEADRDLATNLFTKTIEQKLNVQFNWTTIPFDGAAEKRQISLASGDYPAMYLLIPWVDQFTQTDLLRFGQQGVLLPLNDLIDQYAPNIKATFASNAYYKALNTAPDGKIYGLNQLNQCYHCSYKNKMWINKKWLDKLGLQMPKTTEDFKNVLRAFKTQDPNGNNKQDEVPLSGNTDTFGVHILPFLMNGFIYNNDVNYLILNGKNVESAANKAEWKEALVYIKSLYDEGLIDSGAFTQNAAAFKKIGENDPQILGAGAAGHPAVFLNTAPGNKYSNDYDPVPPLTGPHASYAVFNNPGSIGATFVLTNKASKEQQIAAIKVLDYIYTLEGQLLGNYGEENVDWRKPKDGDVPIEKSAKAIYATIPKKDGGQPRNSSWGALAQYNHSKDFRNGWIQATDIYSPEGYERRLQDATHLYEGHEPKKVFPHAAVWINPASADELSMVQTNIVNYINQNTLQFITGSKSLDKDWDSYVSGLEKLNLKRYLDIMQNAYDSSSLSK